MVREFGLVPTRNEFRSQHRKLYELGLEWVGLHWREHRLRHLQLSLLLLLLLFQHDPVLHRHRVPLLLQRSLLQCVQFGRMRTLPVRLRLLLLA